jgi:hypothetical protein
VRASWACLGGRVGRGRSARLCEQFFECSTNPLQTTAFGKLVRGSARHEDYVGSARYCIGPLRASLTQQALYLVSFNGAADLATDRKSDPGRFIAAARKRVEDEEAVGD